MVSHQVVELIKLYEWKLNSVLKERESAISIIENIVKKVFEHKNYSTTIRAK